MDLVYWRSRKRADLWSGLVHIHNPVRFNDQKYR